MFPWHHMIDEATSLDMVLVLSRDYLACWSPEDLSLIPERARPRSVKGIDDLAFWHQRLVDSYRSGSAKSRECEHVRSMLHFFASALQKASELQGVPATNECDGVARIFSEYSVPKLFSSVFTGANDR
jgi:hypothetical protein